MKKTLLLIALIFGALGYATGQAYSPAVVQTATTPTNCYSFLYALTTASPATIYAPDGSGGCQTLAGGSGGGTTTNPLTVNNSNTGAASGTTFNGSAPVTISSNSVGAPNLTTPNNLSGNGAASTPNLWISGTWPSGSATTDFGGLLLSPTGATMPVLSAISEGLIINSSGTTGTLLHGAANGALAFTISAGGTMTLASTSQARAYATSTNCSAVGTSASPSAVACGSAAAGNFSCAVAASAATCVIAESGVTANSDIMVQLNTSAGTRLGVTCNASPTVIPAGGFLASISTGVSFTINMPTITVNPACFTYTVIN